MKRRAFVPLLALATLALNGCDADDSPSDSDATSIDAGSAPSLLDANISGHYLCALEQRPSSPEFCTTSASVFHGARLIVVEHDGVADIGMVNVVPNSSPVWHGTVSADGDVNVTGMVYSDTGQLTATVNPGSLRDVRLQVVRASPACTHLFVGVCAVGGPQF